MKYAILILLISCVACTSEKTCDQVDPNEAKAVLSNYFTAVENSDFEALVELSTSDFIIYEQGLIWNNDSLINAFQSNPNARYNYALKNFTVKTDCNSALIYYVNDGIISVADSSFTKSWTESASIRRINDTLKVEFIHSTAAK